MDNIQENKTKKEKILYAALSVFSEYGLEKGKVSEIAKRAKIGKGTIYEYFDSKEQIFKELIDFFFQEIFEQYEDVIDAQLSPIEKMDELIDITFDFYDEFSKKESIKQISMLFEAILYSFRESMEDKSSVELDKIFQRFYDTIRPIIDEGVEEGVFKDLSPNYLSYIIFGLIDGFSIHYFVQRNNFNKKKSKKIMKNILLEGLLDK